MNPLVVDTSVAAKWFLDEEHADTALSILSTDVTLHAPDFFLLEMDNLAGKWMRRGIITAVEGGAVRRAFRRIPIKFHPFGLLLDPAFEIAVRSGCAVYDALYVALAVFLGGKVITADQRLFFIVSRTPFRNNMLWIGDF